MGAITRFEDIEAWQLARALCRSISKPTSRTYFYKGFLLRDQIRSSSGSIMDIIAEGFGRDGNAEFKQFRSIAMGSASEVKSPRYRAMGYRYIDQAESETLYVNVEHITGRLANLIKYLKTSEQKAIKYSH